MVLKHEMRTGRQACRHACIDDTTRKNILKATRAKGGALKDNLFSDSTMYISCYALDSIC